MNVWTMALSNLKHVPARERKLCAYRMCKMELVSSVLYQQFCNADCRKSETALRVKDNLKKRS